MNPLELLGLLFLFSISVIFLFLAAIIISDMRTARREQHNKIETFDDF